MKWSDNVRYKAVLAGLILFFSCTGITASASAQWKEEGLDGRAVYKLQLRGDTLYAATDNGVYRRVPAATGNWVPVGLQGRKVMAMEAPSPGVLLASRQPAAPPDTAFVYRSEDAGATWQSIQNDSMQYAGALYEPPFSPGVLFATTQASVLRSDDTGKTWHSVWGSWENIGYGVHFVRQDPNSHGTLWSGGESAIFQPYVLKSTDGGASWSAIHLTAGGDNAVYSAAVQPGNSQYVLVGMEGRIMRTTDGGAAWTTVYQPEGYPYVFGLEFSPADPQTVYATGVSNTTDAQPLVLHRSTDAGANWTTFTYGGAMFAGLPLVDMLLYSGGGSDVLYFGTNDGVYSFTEGTTGVPLPNPGSAVVVAPNPATGDAITLVVQLPGAGSCEVVVLDVSGRRIAVPVADAIADGGYRYTISTAGMPSGVYILRIATQENVVVRRFVVVR